MEKKIGKLKKISIGIFIVVIIISIIVGVLIATGTWEVNLTSKSKVDAGVEKLGETVTSPLDKVSKSIEKVKTNINILNNINENSEVEFSTELSADIEELTIPDLSYSDRDSLQAVIDLFNLTKIKTNIKYDGNESVYLKADGSIDNENISGEILYDGNQIGFRSEELNSKWITMSQETISDFLEESEYSEDDIEEVIDKLSEYSEKIENAVELDDKEKEEIRKRYKDIWDSFIDEKSKNAESESDTVNIDGKEKKCSKLTIELGEDDLKYLLNEFVDTFADDDQVKDLLDKIFNLYADIYEDMGEYELSKSMSKMVDELYDNIDEIKDEIDEIEFDGSIKLVVYASSTEVYRTDVIIDIEGQKVKLEITYNKNETVIDISMSMYGSTVDIGTITLKTDDDLISFKFEVSKALKSTIGDFSFEIKYVSKDSESELNMNGKLGSYGDFDFSVTTNIDTNEDKEFAGTTKISIDIDCPYYITARMVFKIKSDIKLGKVTIPVISSKDSVDIMDENAVEEYQNEVEKNSEKLLEKFSNIEVLKPFFDEVLDEIL